MTNEYKPIACAIHDRIELAIMRARPIELSWTDPGGRQHTRTLTPVATLTRAKEEFLRVEDRSGQQWEIRLDRLRISHSALP